MGNFLKLLKNVSVFRNFLKILVGWLYTYREIHEIDREKWKVYSGVFCITFFAFRKPFFAFRISCQGQHLREKSKDFVVYFFAALIKHKIHVKYEKCIVSVSYFVACFAKYPQNAKYEKCIASLTISQCKKFLYSTSITVCPEVLKMVLFEV